MPDISGLYPQPPTPLGPGQMLGIVGQVNALQQFNAQQAAGRSFQSGINPDGSVDYSKIMTGLQSPDAALAAPQAMGTLLEQRGRMIANSAAQFELGAGQNTFIMNKLAGLATKAGGVSQEDINGLLTDAARGTNIPAADLSGWGASFNGMSKPAAQARIKNVLNSQLGTSGAQQIPGPPNPATGAPGSIALGAAPSGGMATGTPLGSEASSGLMQADLARKGNLQQELFPMQKSLDLLNSLPAGSTGPGTAVRNQIQSFIYSMSPTLAKWLPGVDPSKIQDYDELNKYMTQAVTSGARGFSPDSDARLAAAFSGNPNSHINDLANKDVFKSMIALKRMEATQTGIAQQAGPIGYSAAKANAAAWLDPRAFAIDQMTPDQRQNLQKSLKGPERVNFNRSLGAAYSNGILAPPGGSNAGQ